jgi:hypothetical protein
MLSGVWRHVGVRALHASELFFVKTINVTWDTLQLADAVFNTTLEGATAAASSDVPSCLGLQWSTVHMSMLLLQVEEDLCHCK